ncbi:MAG: ATP-dependent DNA helicase RecG [Xanthomonadales bacterium]|nr:ATP-dependent DNA helicase RecG [Xanthomonadales bacterium]
MNLNADAPITSLPGVGPKVAEKLAKLGLHRCADALFHLPLRYEDRTRIHPIHSVRPGARLLLQGEVVSTVTVGRNRRSMICVLDDGTGRITLRFFNFYPNQQRMFRRRPTLLCYGEVRAGYDGLEIVHPEYSVIAPGTEVQVEASLTPVYPMTEGVGQAMLRRIVSAALEAVPVEELLPEGQAYDLSDALQYVHHPPPDADLGALAEGIHPAQQRLAFEELVAHRLSMAVIRAQTRSHGAPALDVEADLVEALLGQLPFRLTAAQERVSAEISDDLAQPVPMLRLLHGDVGAGKTAVAALAAARCIAGGFQVALSAPTEILAEQHLNTLREWFEPLGIDVLWLSSRIKGRKRKEVLEGLAGGAPLAVGTHALMEEAVVFDRLGLVIVDEQHRFGVRQRLKLRDKGAGADLVPHQLIMTATPIPRTLAMTAYADLDVSVIDELPPGRRPVTTVAISDARRNEVIERVAAACQEGRQVYWVCTLVEESELLQAEAATATADRLSQELEGLAVGLVHGRLKGEEKDSVMAAFKRGEIRLLVATTVIEVGVDVPNASLMIIENAERLGLSQLHQLRGRVGRGAEQSTCVLMYHGPLTEMARQRLDVMRRTNDGFEIARKDLELRGPGEVLGTRQTGAMQFRIADLSRDRSILDSVGRLAAEIEADHPERVTPLIRRWVGDATRYGSV